MLGDDAEAHEIVQDVFLSLFERPEQFGAQSSLNTFLYVMTTNLCLTRLRKQRNRARLLRERPSPDEGAAAHSPDAAALVRSVLDQLEAPLAQVAVYYYVDELSHEEIAGLLGRSRRQVGNYLERLRAWGKAHEGGAACSTG